MKYLLLLLSCWAGLQAMQIVDVNVEGTIREDAFSFALSLTATASRPDERAMLAGPGVALATVPAGDGWSLELDPETGVYALVVAAADTPVTVAVQFLAATQTVEQPALWHSVSIPIVAAPLAHLTVHADRADLDLQLPQAFRPERTTAADGLVVNALLPGGQPLALQWKARITDVEAELLVACKAHTIVLVNPGTLRLDALYRYDVSQGSLRELAWELPADLTVTQVRGADLRDWRVTDDGGRRLVVQLSQPQENAYAIQVFAERQLPALPVQTPAPVLVPRGVTRADGYLAIGTDSAVQLSITDVTGLTQVDSDSFPRIRAGDEPRAWPSARASYYSFAATPFAATIGATDIVPAFDVDSRLVVRAEDDNLQAGLTLELDVRDAPIRRLTVSIPGQFVVAGVSGGAVSDFALAPAAAGAATRDLTIEFGEPVSGRTVAAVELETGRSPLGTDQDLGGISVRDAREQRGFVAVAAAPGVLLGTPAVTDLRPVHTRSLPMHVPDTQYAWRFREAGWSLRLPIAERPAAVRAEAFHVVSIGEGIAYGTVAMSYFVSGAPIDELWFAVDPGLENVEFVGLDVSRWEKVEDLYRVNLRRKVVGDYNLGVSYSQRYADGDAILAGGVEPARVETRSGFLVVASHLNVRVEDAETGAGLIPVGAEELPPQYRLVVAAPILRSYKYVTAPHTAKLTVHAYARGSTPTVLAEFINASTALSVSATDETESVTKVRYTVKNSSAQFLDLRVPAGVKVWATRLIERAGDGQETATRVAAAHDGDLLKIPLRRQQNPNAPLTVEVEFGQQHGDLGLRGHLALLLPPSPVAAAYADWQISAPRGWLVRPGAGGTMVSDTPGAKRGDLVRVLNAVATGWQRALDRAWGLVVFAVVILLAGGAIRRRWVSIAAGAVAGLAVLVLGMAAFALIPHTAVSAAGGTIRFSQVLDLAGDAPMTVAVQLVPTWRANVAVAPLAVGVLALVLAVWAWRRWSRWRALAAGVWVAAVVMIFVQVPVGLVLLRHALTWAAPLALTAAVALWLRVRRPGTVAALLLAAALLGGPNARAAEGIDLDQATVGVHVQGNAMDLDYHLVRHGGPARLLAFLPNDYVPVEVPPQVYTQGSDSHTWRLPAGAYDGTAAFLAALPTGAPGERYEIQVAMPPALQRELNASLPGTDLAVDIPAAFAVRTTEADGRTEVHAVLAPTGKVRVHWRPRTRQTAREATVFQATTTTLARLDNGLVEAEHQCLLRVTRGELTRLRLTVPAGSTVTRVGGADLGAWRFDSTTGALELHLNRPVTGDYELLVATQIAAESMPFAAKLQRLEIEGAANHAASLGLIASDRVTVTVGNHPPSMSPEDFARAAASLLERAERPAAAIVAAFRLNHPDDRVEIQVVAVTPELRVGENASFSVADERLVYSGELTVEVTKAGVFGLDLTVPTGYDIEAVTGPQVSHWDDRADDGTRRLRVHFKERFQGHAALTIALSRSVTGLPATIEVPHVGVTGALKHQGRLVVAVDRGVRLSVRDREGVSELDVADLGMREKPALAFKLLRPDWRLTLASEVLEPRIQTEFLHVAEVSDGLVRHTHYLRYKLQNAGARVFLVQVPDGALGLLVNGPDIARQEQVGNGRWRIELSGKWFDRPYPLRLNYETRYQPDDGTVAVVPVSAPDAELQRGYVVVKTTPRVELSPLEVGAALQLAEARTLPTGFGADDLADAAFCWASATADYTLTLKALRHEAADLLTAEVLQTDITTIVSDLGDTMHQATVRLRTAGKRHLHTWLPVDADVWSLRVDNQSRTPSYTTDAKGRRVLMIPLPQSAGGDLTATVEIVYVIGQVSEHRYDGPRFDLPLRNITWTLYVPEGALYWDFGGTLVADEQTIQVEQVSEYDLDSYMSQTRAKVASELEQAVQLQTKGKELAAQGKQKAAREALQQAYNYSANDKALNEDARVSLRNLMQQQAVVGLVGRRGQVRSERQVPGQQEDSAQTIATEFTQEEAQRVQGALSKADSDNLELITNRLIETQEAAADRAVQLMITLPQRGRRLVFHRPLQVEPEAPMEVSFREARLPAWGGLATWLWAAGLALAVALLLTVSGPLARAVAVYHRRPPKTPAVPPAKGGADHE